MMNSTNRVRLKRDTEGSRKYVCEEIEVIPKLKMS